MIAALEDLQKLSGLKRRTDIRRWLTTNGIAFMVQPSGTTKSNTYVNIKNQNV